MPTYRRMLKDKDGNNIKPIISEVQTEDIDWANLTYKKGETVTIGAYMSFIGFVTSSSTELDFAIPLMRRAATTGSRNITVSCPEFTARKSEGGYVLSGIDFADYDVAVLANSGLNWSENNYIRLRIKNKNGAAFSVTNNTPLVGNATGGLTITFND